LVAIRGAHLDGHLDGTTSAPSKTIQVEQTDKTMKAEANLAYANWYAQDQQLLSFLFNSVIKELLGQIATESSAADAWHAILGMFSSQS
jgi:hypothetical protein